MNSYVFWTIKLWNQMVLPLFKHFDPYNKAILNTLSMSENLSFNGSEDTAMIKVVLPMKRGVVIFGVFAADTELGTHPKLFLGVTLPYIS